jgi:hypothetical protein
VDAGNHPPGSGGGNAAPKMAGWLTGALWTQAANAAKRNGAWSIVAVSLGGGGGRPWRKVEVEVEEEEDEERTQRGGHNAEGDGSFSERRKYTTAGRWQRRVSGCRLSMMLHEKDREGSDSCHLGDRLL